MAIHSKVVVQKVGDTHVIVSNSHLLAHKKRDELYAHNESCALTIYPGYDACFFSIEVAWYYKTATEKQLQETHAILVEQEEYDQWSPVYEHEDVITTEMRKKLFEDLAAAVKSNKFPNGSFVSLGSPVCSISWGCVAEGTRDIYMMHIDENNLPVASHA